MVVLYQITTVYVKWKFLNFLQIVPKQRAVPLTVTFSNGKISATKLLSIDKEDFFMKKQTLYIGSVIILIISVFTFVVFGFGTEVFTAIFGNKNKLPAFGKYDGQAIEYSAGTEFANTASSLAERYKNQGYEINSQAEYYIFSEAFNQTVMNMAFTKAVKKSGYVVPEEAVNRDILHYFVDSNGKYSAKIYNQTDDSTKENYRKDSVSSLTYYRYIEDVLGSRETVGESKLYGIKPPSKEAAFISSMGTEKRSFNLATFDTSNFPKTEAAVFAQTKAELFIKYNISAVTVDEEKDAKALLKQIQNKEVTFEDAIKEKSQKYYTDTEGKLASPYHYQINDMLDSEDDLTAITGLKKDALSNVIKTKRGYTIFRGDGESTAADFNDDATLDVVLKYMKANETGYIENYYNGIAKDFSSEAAINGFDAACEKFGVTMVDVPAFPLNYGDSSFYGTVPASTIKELNGAATNTNVLKTAFSLKLDELSAPLVLGTNVIVLKCTGIQNDEPASTDSYASTITTTDQSSVQATLMASDKLENNF